MKIYGLRAIKSAEFDYTNWTNCVDLQFAIHTIIQHAGWRNRMVISSYAEITANMLYLRIQNKKSTPLHSSDIITGRHVSLELSSSRFLAWQPCVYLRFNLNKSIINVWGTKQSDRRNKMFFYAVFEKINLQVIYIKQLQHLF